MISPTKNRSLLSVSAFLPKYGGDSGSNSTMRWHSWLMPDLLSAEMGITSARGNSHANKQHIP